VAVKTVPRRKRRGDTHSPQRSASVGRFALPVVLVVDDNEDNRELFAMVLERLGYTIELAVDGLDGLERAQALSPNVILMDLAMPRMDGFEATRAIRAIPELASVHIIAVTAFTDALSAQRALAAGCDEVLPKPITPDVLTVHIEAALRTRGGHARDAG
jgi:CheY-like chemotaxis protein